MATDKPEPAVTVFVCGASLCTDGKPHDDLDYVEFDKGAGASVACSRCGSTAFERYLLELP